MTFPWEACSSFQLLDFVEVYLLDIPATVPTVTIVTASSLSKTISLKNSKDTLLF